MSTDTTDSTDGVQDIELEDRSESMPDHSVVGDITVFWILSAGLAFLGGVLLMMGWYGTLAAAYLPRAVLGALAVLVGVGGPLGVYMMLRSDYADLFTQLRQIPTRID